MLLLRILILCCELWVVSTCNDKSIRPSILTKPCVWNKGTNLCWCSYNGTHTDCSGQNLNYIPKVPDNTTILYMNNNTLTTLTFGMLVNISNKDNLKHLDISSNSMYYIDSGLLGVFKRLEILDMSNNPLTHKALLKSFHNISKSLRSLHLNQLELPEFSDQLFLPFKNSDLSFIQLNFNHFHLFNADRLFEYLPNLEGLDLSWNFLKMANFSISKSLTYLYLSYNDLTNFPEFCKNTTLPIFPSLKYLYLDRNCLSTLQMKKVNCLEKLELFNVSETRINTLHAETFKGMKSIKTIALDNIASFVSIKPFAFRSKTLQTISLKDNYLEFKTEDIKVKNVFGGCPQLTKLDISGNFVERLNTRDWKIMFSDIPNLRYLNVSDAGLLYIPKSWPIVIPHLIGLDVGKNSIPRIPANYFVPFKNMSYLTMNRNQFTTFQKNNLPKKLKCLNLIQNPYICDCDLMWFSKFVKKNRDILEYYPREYTCRGTNHTISTFKINKGACSISREVSMVIETACFLLIILILILSSMYKYRWRLRYVFYLFTYHKRQLNTIIESDFQHDIFVSCAREQYEIVLESIVKRLEERESYKVFITERDVQASEPKIGKALANLDQSKFFMICLSNDFCEDSWCEFETIMAMQKSLYENAGNVIVVLLEEISCENMNTQLWWLVRNDEYIFWDESEDACELFWRKLRSRLQSHNNNSQNIPMSNLSHNHSI